MLFIGFFFFLSLAYGTPETATQLTDWIEKVTHGTVIVKPVMDTPVMAQWLFAILGFILFVDGMDLYLRANYSPQVMGAGLNHPYSFNGHLTEIGGFGVVGAGGSAAPIPHDGTHQLVNPLTHIHKIGDHVIFEAMITEDRPLEETPIEVKPFIRSKRQGFFGARSIGFGWLSQKEILKHPQMTFDEGNDRTTTVNTLNVLLEDAKFNAEYDIALQLNDHEGDGLSKSLALLTDIGEQNLVTKETSLKDRLFK